MSICGSSEVSKVQVPEYSLSPEGTHVLFPFKKGRQKANEWRY